ncbi:hypothetical protein BJ912DRAFT_1125700, partial [Pholiota molesta]
VEQAATLILQKKSAQAKRLLKESGLRGLENAFWEIRFSDPHQALSFDHMHNYPHGLGGKHFWKQLQTYILEEGDEAEKKVDFRASEFPRWKGFKHFNQIMDISFSDAMKLQDIVKIIPFITHDILSQSNNPDGYLLLCSIRSYLVLDSYFLMDVHTETTISEGRKEFDKFAATMETYIEATREIKKKNWNIPKMHGHSHGFDDILDKGIMLNYDSILNEALHGSLKDSYLLRTNFKRVDGQILEADHRTFVSQYIRELIEYADETSKISPDDEELSKEEKVQDPQYSFGNISLGAPQNFMTIGSLLEGKFQDKKYAAFEKKLMKFFSMELSDLEDDLLLVYPQTKIREFRFLKATYESWVSSRAVTDYLRCSPNFNHQPRYDHVIVNTPQGPIFAQLVFTFTLKIAKQQYPIALIQPFERVKSTGAQLKKDSDLRFLRLRKVKDTKTEFIFVRSIIRGLVIVPAFDKAEEYVVFDVLDSDMMLRVKEMLRG